MGDRGDWGREHVLDPVMLARVAAGRYQRALDVGCGEGRFCRLLKSAGVSATGIDPTLQLLEVARQRDPAGDYRTGVAERLEFESESFDLVVSYVTLVDIVDFRTAIREMARVLQPGGRLLVANLTGFTSACATRGWVRDEEGCRLHFPGIGRSRLTWPSFSTPVCNCGFSRSPSRSPGIKPAATITGAPPFS